MKYRKKPVTIEAVQFLGIDRGFSERPEWLLKAIYKDEKVKFFGTPQKLDIETLEGTMTASSNDFIIKGVDGEIYPCKPDIFEKTYEIAE